MVKLGYLAAALLLVAPRLAYSEPQSWYVAHLGQDACVPINDIGDDFRRLYYGAGSMKDPDDLVTALQRMGGRLTKQPATDATMVTYKGIVQGAEISIVMFNDPVICKFYMSMLEK